MARVCSVLVVLGLFFTACGGSDIDLSGQGDAVDSGDSGAVAPAGPEGGRAFTDPQNQYQIVIDPAWLYDTTVGDGLAELWFVEPTEIGEFGSNVNVLVQEIGNMSLDTYVEASLVTLEQFIEDPQVEVSETIATADGDERARFVYTGRVGGQRLKFLQYVDVHDGNAIIATLTALPNDFAVLAPIIDPYLATVTAR